MKPDRMDRKRRVQSSQKINWRMRTMLWLVLWTDHNVVKEVNYGYSIPVEVLVRQEMQAGMNTVSHSWQSMRTHDGTMGTETCFLLEGYKDCPEKLIVMSTSKIRNRNVKMRNDNGTMRQHVSVVHWNMGAKHWCRKTHDIEAAILQFNPDIFIITEANMKLTLTDTERKINGYYMILPRTVEVQNHARIVMLVKEGL